MKSFIAISILVLSITPFAHAQNNVAEVTLSSQQTSKSLRLEHDEYKDIFETRWVSEYCERRVLNNSCSYSAQTGMTCRSGGTSCSTDPNWEYDNCYENLRYACEVERSVFVRREFVKKHVHQVEIKLDRSLELGSDQLNLNLTANLSQVLVKLSNSYKKDLIQYDVARTGDSTLVIIKPIMTEAAAEQFRVAALQDLNLDHGGISFVIKDAAGLKSFIRISEIQIEKNRIFNDKIIYSTSKDFEEGGEFLTSGKDLLVNFTSLNSKVPNLQGGKYNLYLKATMQFSDTVLNINDFSYLNRKLEAQIIKVRL